MELFGNTASKQRKGTIVQFLYNSVCNDQKRIVHEFDIQQRGITPTLKLTATILATQTKAKVWGLATHEFAQ